jgi:hypothetical protein
LTFSFTSCLTSKSSLISTFLYLKAAVGAIKVELVLSEGALTL